MKILFISHDGSRTGAPFVLLHLCKWLKNFSDSAELSFDVLFLSGGPLISEFRKYSNSVFVKKPTTSLSKRIIKNISPDFHNKYLEENFHNLCKNEYSLLYANSIASLNVAIELKKKLDTPLILHLHELFLTIDYYHKDLAHSQKYVDCFICVSQAVAKNAIENYSIPEDKVKVVYEFVDFENLTNRIVNQPKIEKQKDEFIVCASGTLNSRKNPDSFIQVAQLVKKRLPKENIKFLWIGASDDRFLQGYEMDVMKLKHKPQLEFIKQTENPFMLFNTTDVFLMTSREDPFPLVCIEAGYLGKPIICFDDAGGIPEMLSEGGGKVVDYLDNEAMAEAVIDYYSNRVMLAKESRYIQNKVKEYDVLTQGPKIWDIIQEVTSATE